MFIENEHKSSLNELTFRLTDTPTVQERVLAHLLDSGGEEATESSIRDALDLPKATAHVAVRALVEQGLVRDRRVGRTALYWVDADDALIRSLKLARSIRRAQNAIASARDSIDLAVLFGSAAKGEDRAGSDVDLLVVADDTEAVLNELLPNQWLQPVVMTSTQHMALIADGGTFAREVARGVVIWERR